MADLTKAQLASRILEHLGVKAAGQSASATDSAFVEEAIDAAHERLRKFGLAPFAISAIPPWAQIPLRDYVSGDVAQSFGLGGARLGEFKGAQALAERDLGRQVSGYRHAKRISPEYF
jgi:hypothetical protein